MSESRIPKDLRRRPNTLLRVAVLGALVTLIVVGEAQLLANPRVIDLNPTEEPFSPFLAYDGDGVVYRGLYYFLGNDGRHGEELWVSDGTEEGTRLLRDLDPGPVGSAPRDFLVADGLLFFSATDSAHGRELWVTDGTPENTERITDLAPGAASSSPSDLAWDGGLLFFAATTLAKGRELAVWDGSEATVLELQPGVEGVDPVGMTVGPARGVFFSAYLEGVGRELFFSNGTSGGTDLVADIFFGENDSDPEEITLVSDEIVFSARDESLGRELVRYRPSTGVLTVEDLRDGAGGSFPKRITPFSDVQVFFIANDGSAGEELWDYLRVTGAIERRTDIDGGAANGVGGFPQVLGNKVCFSGWQPATGWEPWCYDVLAGARPLGDLESGTDGSSPSSYLAVDGWLYFHAYSGPTWGKLWRSDGTAAGTEVMNDFDPDSTLDSGRPLAWVDETLLVQLSGVDGRTYALAETSRPRVWSMLSEEVLSSSLPRYMASDGDGGVRFTAYRPHEGNEPWTADGESARLIEDLVPGEQSSWPRTYLVHRDRTAMVGVEQGSIAGEPYVWDGASVQQINLSAGDSEPWGLAAVGDRVLTASSEFDEEALWAIDPVTSTTEQLTTDRPGRFVGAGALGLFAQGFELWKTDGTAVGTELLATAPERFRELAVLTEPTETSALSALLTTETFPEDLIELWHTDGTTTGTQMLLGSFAALGFAEDLLVPPWFAVSGGLGLLAARLEGATHRELFVTDGTVAGTQQITQRASDDFVPEELFVIGAVDGGWIYQDWHQESGPEIWFTDGTITEIVELVPGVLGSRPVGLDDDAPYRGATIDGELVFSAYTEDRGYELWRSDGTASGTVPLRELRPGEAGEPLDLIASGGRAWAAGHGPDGEGRELVVYELALFEDGFESGDTNAWSSVVP